MQYDVNKLYVKPITAKQAKALVKIHHYMKTWPAGAKLFFGVMHEGASMVLGAAVFGKSATTDKKTRFFKDAGNIGAENIIEMQRLWLSDQLGANAESKTLANIIKVIKWRYPQVKIIWTYAGGCKNDCGIVYQAAGFLYLGCDVCEDFYLTASGEYKNLVNVMRFGKGPKGVTDKAELGRYVYGPGKTLKTKRYYYCYPIDKSVRRKMAGKVKPNPKDSDHFRRGQQWV